MRIPRYTDYRFILLLSLARAEGECIPLRRIAETYQLPLPFLRSIASQLVRQGLIISREGAAGGYRLAKPAKQINLADVLAGEYALIEDLACQKHAPGPDCPRETFCIAAESWQHVHRRLDQALSAITLEEVMT